MLALQLWPTVGFSYDGQTFTYNVKVTDSIKVKWVKMTFMVISETNKTAQIGSGRYDTSCIDNTTVGDVVIPATVNRYNIVAINSYAFYKCSNLKTIDFPKSVSSIGRCAFLACI